MSARSNFENKIFNNIYVVEFHKKENTHATWKCICMPCGKVFYKRTAHLTEQQNNGCKSCGNKKTTYTQERDIEEQLRNTTDSISLVAEENEVPRHTVMRIAKESLIDLNIRPRTVVRDKAQYYKK